MLNVRSVPFASGFSAALLAFLLLSCAGPPRLRFQFPAGEPYVRVCLNDQDRQIEIGLDGDIELRDGTKKYRVRGKSRLKVELGDNNLLVVSADGVYIGGFSTQISCTHISSGRFFRYKKRTYSDTLRIVADGETLLVLNVLPMERYLGGVVPNEIGHRKKEESEAIMAQAVLARTYAMSKVIIPMVRLFDVYDDTRDQVFTGAANAGPLVDAALRNSRGVVLAYGDQLARVFYHSTCGGATAAPEETWSTAQHIPYLTSIRDRSRYRAWCSPSPFFRWKKQYSRTRMEQIIRKYLPATVAEYKNERFSKSDFLLGMFIKERYASGRVKKLDIVFGNKQKRRTFTLFSDKIRYVLREPAHEAILNSTLFNIHITRDTRRWITSITIEGAGKGHGVGMCQWGAIGHARAGISFERILEFYFPGTHLTTLY
ncbi:MAG: SpoIID/LytB domain-containing protein [Chlorobi bacterium]|nr:SpoIID/LytB domain-containing protein [Chlorobiota bacterium]